MKLDRRQFAAGAAALAGLSGEALAQAVPDRSEISRSADHPPIKTAT